MRVLAVAAEMLPWCRTGGLGDVVGALPAGLGAASAELVYTTCLPLYPVARAQAEALGVNLISHGDPSAVRLNGVTYPYRWMTADDETLPRMCFWVCEALLNTDGLYDPPDPESGIQAEHRFAAFCLAIQQDLESLAGGTPDIVHLHDWHTGPLASLLQRGPGEGPKTVLTIHNLAYQGWTKTVGLMELFQEPPPDDVSFLRLGIENANVLTTVSPKYAREIQTEAFGCGAEELLAERGVIGILNGVNGEVWNPSLDPFLSAPFHADDLTGKAKAREALLGLGGWNTQSEEMVIGMVGRLAHQKGLDVLVDAMDQLVERPIRLAILGTGDDDLEAALRVASTRHPERLATWIRFDDGLSHQVIAGADALLIPSRFEPCGLTQMYALRYGTLPIVNPVGGLADTVFPRGHDNANGFLLPEMTAEGLVAAIDMALAAWDDAPTWRLMQQNGFRANHDWVSSGQAYLTLFASLLDA